MKTVIGIKYPFINQTYYVEVNEDFEPGTYVKVKANHGKFLYEVAQKRHAYNKSYHDLKPVKSVEVATADEIQKYLDNQKICEHANKIFRRSCAEINYNLELLGSTVSLCNKNIKFTYYSEQRIEFKQLITLLIKRLPRQYKIELFQVGNREYFSQYGGYGICGYELCCHVRNFSTPPITINQIKYLSYRLDIKGNLLGSCGKYRCCLLYEADEYEQYTKYLPDLQSKIKYKDEVCEVLSINIFEKLVTLRSNSGRFEVAFSELMEGQVDESN